MTDHPHGTEPWYLAQVGLNPDRSFGPNYRIRACLPCQAYYADHVYAQRPGCPCTGGEGLPAYFGPDGRWRLAEG